MTVSPVGCRRRRRELSESAETSRGPAPRETGDDRGCGTGNDRQPKLRLRDGEMTVSPVGCRLNVKYGEERERWH